MSDLFVFILFRGGIEEGDDSCEDNYFGVLCQNCVSSFFKDPIYQSCNKCLSVQIISIIMGIAFLFYLVFYFFMIKTDIDGIQTDTNKDKLASNYLKSLLNFIQFCSVLLNQFEFPSNVFDSTVSQTFQLFSGYFFSFFSLDCLLQNVQNYPAPIYIEALVLSLIPIFMVLLTAFFTKKMKKSSRFLVCLSTTIFLLQPMIIQSLLNILKCKNLYGDFYFLADDLKILCYTEEHRSWIYFLVIPSLLIYALIFPILFMFKVYWGIKKFENEYEFKERVGFLIHGFQKRIFYWEYILLWEKLGLIILAIFWVEIYSKVLLALLFLLLISGLEHKIKPLLTKKLNSLELNCHLSLVGILLFRALKIKNTNNALDILISAIILAIQLQFIGQCIFGIIAHKFDKIPFGKKNSNPQIKFIFDRASRYFENDDRKNEVKEYGDNILSPTHKERVTAFRNVIKEHSLNDEKQEKEIEEVIKMLSLQIKKLKKVVKELTEENQTLKKEVDQLKNNVNVGISSPALLSPNPWTNQSENLLTKGGEFKNNTKEKIIENSRFLNWVWFFHRIEEEFDDFKMTIFRKYISPKKHTEISDLKYKVQNKCKILEFNFMNIGEELIKNMKIKLKISDSIILF